MARQTYYVTTEQRHPLYKTRMLSAGEPLVLDAGAAALFRKLGVEMVDQPKDFPTGKEARQVAEGRNGKASKRRSTRRRPAKK